MRYFTIDFRKLTVWIVMAHHAIQTIDFFESTRSDFIEYRGSLAVCDYGENSPHGWMMSLMPVNPAIGYDRSRSNRTLRTSGTVVSRLGGDRNSGETLYARIS